MRDLLPVLRDLAQAIRDFTQVQKQDLETRRAQESDVLALMKSKLLADLREENRSKGSHEFEGVGRPPATR